MAATRPLVLFNPDEEGVELEVERAWRKTHVHGPEELHARARQASGLSQQRHEEKLPVGAASAAGQTGQDPEEEANSLRVDELGSLQNGALPCLLLALFRKRGQCSAGAALAVGGDERFQEQPSSDACGSRRNRPTVSCAHLTLHNIPVRLAEAAELKSSTSSSASRTCTSRTAVSK